MIALARRAPPAKAFSRDKFNDKLPYGIFGNSAADVTTPFYTATQRAIRGGWASAADAESFGRVFVLTTGNRLLRQ